MLKGLTDEVGGRQLYMSSLYEYLPLFEADPEGRRAATEVALCELIRGTERRCDWDETHQGGAGCMDSPLDRTLSKVRARAGRFEPSVPLEQRFVKFGGVVGAVPCAAELRVCRRRNEAADLSREQPGEFDRRRVLTLGPDDLQAHR
jgi:hypothetical protein